MRTSLDTEPTRSRGINGFRRLKSGDLIDVFSPSFSTALVTAAGSAESPGATSGQKANAAKRDPNSHRRPSPFPTSVDFLDAVVSVYELLETDERREAVLRIGRSPKLPYSRAFCRVKNYFHAKGERIFHGGVRVRLHGPNFAVRFFDRIVTPDAGRATKVLDVSLYLKRETLLGNWNGRFLIAQLAEAAKWGNYAHCYFFGRIEPHPIAPARLMAVVERLDYLAFTVRRTGAGLVDGKGKVASRQTRTA